MKIIYIKSEAIGVSDKLDEGDFELENWNGKNNENQSIDV